jgi:hypothetical protein
MRAGKRLAFRDRSQALNRRLSYHNRNVQSHNSREIPCRSIQPRKVDSRSRADEQTSEPSTLRQAGGSLRGPDLDDVPLWPDTRAAYLEPVLEHVAEQQTCGKLRPKWPKKTIPKS